ncbi:MAG: N-acetylmuramoyl-L-alanine amidase, partial [Limosilactobacillus sp.]
LGHASSRNMFQADYRAYVALARDMAGKYGIPLTLDQGGAGTNGIKSHRWVSQHIWGDHQDPYEYLVRYGVSKQDLANDLAGR